METHTSSSRRRRRLVGRSWRFIVLIAVVIVGLAGPTRAAFAGAVPNPPTNVYAKVAGSSSVAVHWTAPFDAGSPITGYEIATYQGKTLDSVHTVDVPADAASAVVKGLHSGVTYTFTVKAANGTGWGAESDHSNPVTLPGNVPDPPSNVWATAAGNNAATVYWSAPYDGGSPITGYVITTYLANTPAVVATLAVGNTTSAVVPGLTNGVSYSLTVTAVNALGQSAPSAPSSPITLPTSPGLPRNVSASPGDSSAHVTWDPPVNDGGRPICRLPPRIPRRAITWR